jgi:hypothetical protein
VEIVDLPLIKRAVEWPTAALAFAIYVLWLLATLLYRDLTWWALAGDWRVDHRLAIAPAARNHSRPSDAKPPR